MCLAANVAEEVTMVREFNPMKDMITQQIGIYEVVYSPLLGTATVKKPGLLVPEVVYEAEDPGAFESAITRANELAAGQ
jgi:hypothetical protein